MQSTPKANRLHIGIFGKRNVGKSSIINKITNQEISIVSDTAGTTTDAVEKSMELLPIGPVVLIDTAGIDDIGDLGKLRINKTKKIYDRTDIAIIVCDSRGWDNNEIEIFNELQKRKIPVISVVNKQDIEKISENNLKKVNKYVDDSILTNCNNDDNLLIKLKSKLIEKCPQEFITPQSITGKLVNENDTVVMVIPIDKEAPKGRLILPQVQTLRDLLDNGCNIIVTRDSELEEAIKKLKKAPDLVITDSQAFATVSEIIPKKIKLTSFSILFANMKGDLRIFQEGANQIDKLQDNEKVLICESCTHHQIEDDIATVKIPKLIKQKTGKQIIFEYYSGHDFPENLRDYKLLIHCGACMTNRKEVLSRVLKCKQAGIPITNYGISIAHCLGILNRAIEPFNKID